MKTKMILAFFLGIMILLAFFAVFFPEELRTVLNRPSLYEHVLFIHIFSVTLFFANAVVGILWEMRSLTTGRKDIILHTYNTVAWLDARLSSPMILLSLIGAIMLSVMSGNIWEIGWQSLSLFLFIFSGIAWVVSDIPTQYKIKNLMNEIAPEDQNLPPALTRLLKQRVWISMAGVIPLVVVFMLMIYKPEITAPADWFGQ